MPDRFCAHGKPLSGDCFECDMDSHARDSAAADQVKLGQNEMSPEQWHHEIGRFRDAGYPTRACSICGRDYAGPLSVCCKTCEEKANAQD